MKFQTIDCCPTPTQLYPLLKTIKDEIGCVYQSVYRGSDKNAAKYLTGAPPCNKHAQAWIYAHYPPGVANPPGKSTHELRNDGTAYKGWAGMPLHWWQCGIDVDDGHVASFIKAAARHGWHSHITYPGSKVEYHHVNLTKEPRIVLFKPLKHGAKGARVKTLTHRLAYIENGHGHHYLRTAHSVFDNLVEEAVKQYQRDHKQKADGIVGPQTQKQLDYSVRYWKKRRKAKK